MGHVPWGGTWGGGGGAKGSKFYFFEHGHVAYQIEGVNE